MNIKNRIKKIEEKVNLNNAGSEFCDCFEKYLLPQLEEIYNARKAGDTEAFSRLETAPVLKKGFCNNCKKPLSIGFSKFTENAQKRYDARRKLNSTENEKVKI